MKAISGKKFCLLLEAKGWKLKRINGSHHIYVKTGVVFRISVPVHGNKPLKIGLQKHLIKIAEIDESEICGNAHNKANALGQQKDRIYQLRSEE